MKKILLLVVCLVAGTFCFAAADSPKILRWPTLSRTQIAFTYANDLWIVGRGAPCFEFPVVFDRSFEQLAHSVPGVGGTNRVVTRILPLRKPGGDQQLVTLIGADPGVGPRFPLPQLPGPAGALEPRLARLVIEVGAPVDGLAIERDGVPVAAPAWGIAVPVDPGPHAVTAHAPGRKSWSASAVVPSAAATVVVSVPALETLPAKEPPATPAAVAPPSAPAEVTLASSAPTEPSEPSEPSEPTAPTGRRFSPLVVALGSLGAAGLASGLVFALQLRSDNDRAKALCPQSTCATAEEKTRHDGLVGDARRDRAIAYVSAGIGAAALLTAAYLWWRPGRAPAPRTSTPRLSAAAWLPSPAGIAGMAGAELEIAW